MAHDPRSRDAAGPADEEAELEPQGGDEELMRALYAEHSGPLLAFVLRLTAGDRQRAEDVVQETLLRAWRNAGQLRDWRNTNPRPWLVTVARRIVIDGYRSEKARPAEALGREPEEYGTVADESEQVLRSLTVADALRTLTPSHREILVETYFRGCTVPEAAETLGLPLGTAKSRVYYALRALRAALRTQGVTEQ